MDQQSPNTLTIEGKDMTQMHSSGEERTFASGAVRDSAAKKPMLHLISPHLHNRLGEWLRFACKDRKPKPYPERNWEKGMPFGETIGAIERHIQKYKLGENIEDNLAAIAFGVMALIHYDEEIKAGRMDPSIDDMPKYAKPLLPCPRCRGAMKSAYCAETGPECYCTACGLASLDAWPSEQTETRIMQELKDRGVGDPAKSDEHVQQLHRITEETCGGNQEITQGVLPEIQEHIESPTFYVAGPMRGYRDLNFTAFDEAAERGRKLGYTIISPADLDREHGIDPGKDPTIMEHENHLSASDLHRIIRRDVEAIMSLQPERGDGIAVLSGWRDSIGATAEVHLAQWLGLRVVYAENFYTLVENG